MPRIVASGRVKRGASARNLAAALEAVTGQKILVREGKVIVIDAA
jgi:hypothetical protein